MGKGAMGVFGTNMADFQLGLAMDDKAGGYLETDEEIAQDDDPLADIKAAWIMAGEDIKDFTVMKFNKKLREEEKRDFNKNFISGNTDYEEKIDLRVAASRHSLPCDSSPGMMDIGPCVETAIRAG